MRRSRRLPRRSDDNDAPDEAGTGKLLLVFGLPFVLCLVAALMFVVGGDSRRRALTVETADGTEITGHVVHENDREVVLQTERATLRLDRAGVRRSQPATYQPRAVQSQTPGRFRHWRDCVDVLAERVGVEQLRQIPATVVDTGSLQNVPYVSHRDGDLELNVYGDPDAPAAIELGLVRGADMSAPRKQLVLDILRRLLTKESDKAMLDKLNLAEDKQSADGLTFEVTPPTATDSEEGWWISVYDPDEAQRARANAAELSAITTRRVAGAKADNTAVTYEWRDEDYSHRDAGRSANGSSREKSVYVQGYTRKDGTYVHAHTRSAPTRHR